VFKIGIGPSSSHTMGPMTAAGFFLDLLRRSPGGQGAARLRATLHGSLAFTGKVSSLLYDRWGDFEGFTLDTEAGERLFRSREHTIEDIANRAWTERILVVVYARAGDPHRPERIVFKYAPRPYWG